MDDNYDELGIVDSEKFEICLLEHFSRSVNCFRLSDD